MNTFDTREKIVKIFMLSVVLHQWLLIQKRGPTENLSTSINWSTGKLAPDYLKRNKSQIIVLLLVGHSRKK